MMRTNYKINKAEVVLTLCEIKQTWSDKYDQLVAEGRMSAEDLLKKWKRLESIHLCLNIIQALDGDINQAEQWIKEQKAKQQQSKLFS